MLAEAQSLRYLEDVAARGPRTEDGLEEEISHWTPLLDIAGSVLATGSREARLGSGPNTLRQ